MTESQKKRINEMILLLFEEVEDIPVADWAEKHLVIPDRMSPGRGGPLSLEGMQYLREPLETFRDVSATDVVLCFSAQVGKTTCGLIGKAYWISNVKKPVLFSMDSADNARFYVDNRWLPFIEENEIIARLKPINTDDLKKLEQHFKSCTVRFIGAKSPGKAASFSAQLVIQDETDKCNEAGGGKEAASWYLQDVRTFAFGAFGKRFKMSTPTHDDGVIWTNYLKGDQRKRYVPSPYTGELFVLEWDGLRFGHCKNEDGTWDLDRVKNETYYECPFTGKPIYERDKRKMDADGVWKPTNPAAKSSFRSYHLNVLYSPFKTWGEIAVDWIGMCHEPDGLKNFYNSYLALPWRDAALEIDEKKLESAQGDYDRGQSKGKVFVLCIDVQRKDLRFNLRGYDNDGSYLIDNGTLADWSDVDDLQEKYGVDFVGIDAQFPDRQQEVFDAISFRRNKNWFALEGKGHGQIKKLIVPEMITPHVGKRRKFSREGKIQYLQINSEAFKGQVAKARHAEYSWWKVYREPSKQYVRELFSERQHEKTINGRTFWEWKSRYKDNHQFDLETYQFAIAHWKGLISDKSLFKPKQSAPTSADAPKEKRVFLTPAQRARMQQGGA